MNFISTVFSPGSHLLVVLCLPGPKANKEPTLKRTEESNVLRCVPKQQDVDYTSSCRWGVSQAPTNLTPPPSPKNNKGFGNTFDKVALSFSIEAWEIEHQITEVEKVEKKTPCVWLLWPSTFHHRSAVCPDASWFIMRNLRLQVSVDTGLGVSTAVASPNTKRLLTLLPWKHSARKEIYIYI